MKYYSFLCKLYRLQFSAKNCSLCLHEGSMCQASCNVLKLLNVTIKSLAHFPLSCHFFLEEIYIKTKIF